MGAGSLDVHSLRVLCQNKMVAYLVVNILILKCVCVCVLALFWLTPKYNTFFFTLESSEVVLKFI